MLLLKSDIQRTLAVVYLHEIFLLYIRISICTDKRA